MDTTGTSSICPPAHHSPIVGVGGIGWGGQYLFAFPKLDLAVAMNCGIYHQPVTEQIAIARAVLAEVVFPSLAQLR